MMLNTQVYKTQPANLTAAVKEQNLRALMREMQTVLVAYSGGVDSAYLALIATQELGENAHCILGVSPSVSRFQREEAAQTAARFAFNFRIIGTDEINDPSYRKNPVNRCYFCKTELYGKLQKIAGDEKINFVIDGTNADDIGDFRPGRRAADEKSVRSPLVEVGLSKNEIRNLSKIQNLPTWDKPASPCLSSRIAYGTPVTIEKLSKVERGEDILRKLGFVEFRVRLHGELVRLEIAPVEMKRILNTKIFGELSEKFNRLGFRYVTLDLQGFRSGALNEVLDQ